MNVLHMFTLFVAIVIDTHKETILIFLKVTRI